MEIPPPATASAALSGDGSPAILAARGPIPDMLGGARRILGFDRSPQAFPLPSRVEELWRRDGFAANVPFTNAMFVPMGPGADPGLLQELVAGLAARHAGLRTRLAVDDGRAVQIVEPWKADRLEMDVVTRADLEDSRPGRASPAALFSQADMDLHAQDGFRCRLFRDEAGNVTVGFLAHGFFADAWSSQVLLKDIPVLLSALKARTSPDIAPAASYTDYAFTQRRALAAALPERLAYWRTCLAPMPPVRLPYDREEGVERRGRSFFFVDQDMAARLGQAAEAHRVSLMILLLAAYQLSLARWSGQMEQVSAAYTADRVNPQFRDAVGMLVTNMPVASRVEKNVDFGAFLQGLSRRYYGSYVHRELSCELYEAVFEPKQPFCATVFNFVPLQKNADAPHAVPAFEGILTAPDAAKPAIYRDLYLGLSQHPNGILGKLFYHAGRFTPAAMEDFVRHFRAVLHQATKPGAKTEDFLS